MKDLSAQAKAYILGTIIVGSGLTAWMLAKLDWGNYGLYPLAALGAIAQTLKVEGPNDRTNYSIAWFFYGYAFITLGLDAAIFIILISHLVEWAWHKYPWFIQSFNIGNHVIAVFSAGLVFEAVSRGSQMLDLNWMLGLVTSNLVFVFGNHFLVGLVVKLARGQSFAESGVFELLTLSLDFTVLTLGSVTALAWSSNPFLSILNVPLLYPLYRALRIPAQMRRLASTD